MKAVDRNNENRENEIKNKETRDDKQLLMKYNV